jgi:hypothetical protein
MYLSKWSRPEISNAVRELSHCCGVAKEAHFKALYRVMKYFFDTKWKGWILKPNRRWNGKKGIKFEVVGWSDSNYAACVESRKSVSGKFIGDDVFMKLLQDEGEVTNGAPTPTGAYSDGHRIYKELYQLAKLLLDNL